MTYTPAECTVENSWWWAEELPETCRVFWQNKFGKLVRLLFLLKIFYKILVKSRLWKHTTSSVTCLVFTKIFMCISHNESHWNTPVDESISHVFVLLQQKNFSKRLTRFGSGLLYLNILVCLLMKKRYLQYCVKSFSSYSRHYGDSELLLH